MVYDNDISADAIMEKVRKKIKDNKGRGEMSRDIVTKERIENRLDMINNSWDIGNYTYTITSHHKVIGPVLISGRRIVHGEVARYMDPVVQKQKAFNESVSAALLDLRDYLNLRIGAIDGLKIEMEGFKKDMCRLERDVREIDYDIKNRSWIEKLLSDRSSHLADESGDKAMSDVDYLAFENRFRGTVDDIKQRQAAFIGYFNGGTNVVDIGSGRGEFLELMRENGIVATGVDIDDSMVRYCLSKGLNAQKSDALEFIESLEDRSVDGIFIDQVVEHLEPGYLVRLLSTCSKKMKEGCYIVVETVNPLSLQSFVNFYIDMSHVRPVHPSTLEFLLESVGFYEVKINFIAPVPDYVRLEKLESVSDADRALVDAYNRNVEKLNNILYGAQDYYAVAKK